MSPGLADVPDALTAGPGDRLIALTSGGSAQLGTGGGKTWTPLSSVAALTATPAGQACRPTGFSAAAFSGSGLPMLAADCSRAGTVGIFADRSGSWHTARPGAARVAGQRGHWGAQADRLRRRHRGPAAGRVRRGGQPDRRLVGRQRRPVDPVGSAAHRHQPGSVPRRPGRARRSGSSWPEAAARPWPGRDRRGARFPRCRPGRPRSRSGRAAGWTRSQRTAARSRTGGSGRAPPDREPPARARRAGG